MTDELFRDAVGFAKDAAQIQQIISSAFLKAPKVSKGVDKKRTIFVTIGRGGFLDSIEVAPDWRKRLSPESFDEAVAEAYKDAARKRLDAWTRALEQDGWRDKFDRLKASRNPMEEGDELPAAFRRKSIERCPRNIETIVEDVLSEINELETSQTTNGPAVSSIGADGDRNVVISLQSNGLLSCRTNPRWVEGQSASVLTRALKEAAGAARRDLVTGMKEKSKKPGRNDVLDELMALLKNPDRFGS